MAISEKLSENTLEKFDRCAFCGKMLLDDTKKYKKMEGFQETGYYCSFTCAIRGLAKNQPGILLQPGVMAIFLGFMFHIMFPLFFSILAAGLSSTAITSEEILSIQHLLDIVLFGPMIVIGVGLLLFAGYYAE